MTTKRKRTNFSESQKAEIYARDHATCAFSGISLWLFDYGIRSNYQMDWADHIKPSARGGTSAIENGISASHTFNAKKKDNSSDNVFFFHHGRVTPAYVETFGCANHELLSDIERRSNLVAADWYLNRAACNVFIGFDWRAEVELSGRRYKRTDEYWFKSAFKRFNYWQKRKLDMSLVERNLIKQDTPFGTELLLELESVNSEKQFYDWIETVWPTYRNSVVAFYEFYKASNYIEQSIVLDRLAENPNLHPEVLAGLSQLQLDDPVEILKAA